MLFLDLHRYGFVVGWMLGLWLFPLGVLVFKSGFLPRILGVLLIAACFGYLADNLSPLLLPSYEDVVGRVANIGPLRTMGRQKGCKVRIARDSGATHGHFTVSA